MFRKVLLALGMFGLIAASAQAQTITVDGLTDRATYTDSVAFRVQTNAGFTYLATLNGVPVPVGVTNRLTRMDYYDFVVTRTNTSNNDVTNVLVRFIVLSSRRGSPELGLIEWVPLPPIPSTAAEVNGAQLFLMTPQDYPTGLDIPLVARVENPSGSARRVNGWMSAPGHEFSAFRILRGLGHGFLPPAGAPTNLSYTGTLQSLQTNKQINIESNTVWTTVSGILGNTTWATNSRIHVTGNLTIPAGNTLTIEAGTIVKLNAGINITNSGRTVINGTVEQPVVFTSTNRVAPEQRTGAWGGWFLRGASAELIATAAIMTGSGAASSISFSPGSSHRSEQPLLFVHSNARVSMTNCALINNAGQVGNGYFSTMTFDRCLIQRAITMGEYEGCTNIIKNSAMIEFPSVDGVYNATIADSDYDGYYLIRGTNYLEDTLIGFAKDDAIDSGSGGPGAVTVNNCWIESALHEALAWSGEGRRTWTYNTVLINSGQGFECGWSTGTNSPLCFGSNIFTTANSVGARYGDNYTGTTGLGLKAGFLTVTNSFILHNYRDIFGRPWDNTWNWRTNDMDVRSNFVTAPNTNHPFNVAWNPAGDGPKLAALMTTPANAPVGIGLASWFPLSTALLTNGIPVRLSSFTTNQVTVDYAIETPDTIITSGTLTFTAGETVKNIFGNPSALAGESTWRVTLRNPVGGEITGTPALYTLPGQQTNAPTTLVAAGSSWRYLDDASNQGTAWRAIDFADNTWSNGLAQLGFGDNDEATRIRQTNGVTGLTNITFYFRRAFTVSNPAAFANLSMWMLRDDGCIVYLNGTEMFRSPSMPPAPAVITFTTFANQQGAAPPDNTIDMATLSAAPLVAGTNVVAVELHQFNLTSTDASFDFSLMGNPAGGAVRLNMLPFGDDLLLYWTETGFALEAADQVAGPWTFVSAESPVTVDLFVPQKFFRLRKP
jgi:hypothetical protein